MPAACAALRLVLRSDRIFQRHSYCAREPAIFLSFAFFRSVCAAEAVQVDRVHLITIADVFFPALLLKFVEKC